MIFVVSIWDDICCFNPITIIVPHFQPASPVPWFFFAVRAVAVGGLFSLPWGMWFAVEFYCFQPFGSWSDASYHNLKMYISSSMRTNSLDRLFFTSAVFIVNTDSRVSFSLLRICTYFLWLLSSLEMFLICCWVRWGLLLGFGVCPWARQGCYWRIGRFRCRSCCRFCQPWK